MDPNLQIIKVVDQETGVSRLVHQQIGNNFDANSIRTDETYKLSAIGEMNDTELDQLKAKNAEKMKAIENQYHQANSEIMTAKEIMKLQQDQFEIKEK